MSPELVAAIAAYPQRIAAVGGYGARVTAVALGTDRTLVVGVLGEVGSGGYQPIVTTDDGRRYRVHLDTIRVASS